MIKLNPKIISFLNILIVIIVMSSPYFVVAQGVDTSENAKSRASANEPLVDCTTVESCNWNAFLETLNKVKDYGFQIVAILSIIFITIAGMYYLTANGDTGKIQRAHNILTNVAVGFFLAAAGWLIVSAILKTLGVKTGFAPPSLLQNQGIQ